MVLRLFLFGVVFLFPVSVNAQAWTSLDYGQRVHLQQALIKLGFLDGKADGDIGPRSRAALDSFLAPKGLSSESATTAELISMMPPQVPGFEVLSGYDLPEGDYRKGTIDPGLAGISLSSCQLACSSDRVCQAYTYNVDAQVCFLKDQVNQPEAFSAAVSGRRSETEVAGPPPDAMVAETVPAKRRNEDGVCLEPVVRLVPEREGIDPIHTEVLNFLELQNVPLGGFTGDYKPEFDTQGGLALFEGYVRHVEASRRAVSDDQLGILLFDLVRLYYVIDDQSQLSDYFAYRKEAEGILDGLSRDRQAADLGAALAVLRRSLNPEDVTRMEAVRANHQRHFGLDRRQWSFFEAVTGGSGIAYPYAPSDDRLAIRKRVFDERIAWAKALGDRRLVIDSIGGWLQSETTNVPGQARRLDDFTPLLPHAREIFDEVEARAVDDLAALVPLYESGSFDLPCRDVSVATVTGVMNVMLRSGTPSEKEAVLKFGVLHTLNRDMFATEPIGAAEMAVPLLRLKLVEPALFDQAASYLTGPLMCEAGEPPLACSLWAFASTYDALNAGTLSLDFARSAQRITHEASPGSDADLKGSLQLARYEWERGSVAAAQELYSGAADLIDLYDQESNYEFPQMVVDLGYELALANLDDVAAQEMVVATVGRKVAAQEDLSAYDASYAPGPTPRAMVRSFMFGETCADCSEAATDAAERWLETQLAYGDPQAFLLQRLRQLDDKTRRVQADRYLARLFGPRPQSIAFDEGALSGLSPQAFSVMRSSGFDSHQLATALALSQLHPHPPSLEQSWALDFVRFMVEPDLATKRSQYADLLLYESPSLDFGDDRGYMIGLSEFSRMARLAGYALTAQIADEHLVRMFDNKFEYLGGGALDTALEGEDAELVVPALARLAQAAFDADDIDLAREYSNRAGRLALATLSGNWETSDQRTVLKYRQLESGLRLAAQVLVKVSARSSDEDAAQDAFEALQMVMLGDTALTALSSQRRRLLVDDRARSAVSEATDARNDLTLLAYYSQVVGIGDPAWEARERRSRQERLDAAEADMATLFAEDASLSLEPVAVRELAEMLRPDEALIVLHSGTDGLYGVMATRETAPLSWVSDIGGEDLGARVRSIRLALDLDAPGPRPAYPFSEAHGLLRDILGPAFGRLDSYERILLVVDGPLQSLPLSVLPLEVPSIIPQTPADFRGAGIRWLGAEKALLYLPTVNSIRARMSETAEAGAKPFVGFGDPVFGDVADGVQQASTSLYDARGIADQMLLGGLDRLIASRLEVTKLADLSGASPQTDVILGEHATERAVKDMDLSDYRVVLFATHGLTAGQMQGIDEPGLALTTPAIPSVEDDGYLGLSEVMQLRLGSELVILSACNTAAPDGRSSSPGLSGLARGFLAAGTQSVAVTHWAIPGADIVPFNVAWFEAKNGREEGDWADALQIAVSRMIYDTGPAHYAHPSYWGAFVVYGAPPA